MERKLQYLALGMTGVMAGFFYAWSVSTMQAFDTMSSEGAIDAMNAVNANIKNFGFGIGFFGTVPVVLMAAAANRKGLAGRLQAAAAAVYLTGVLGFTVVLFLPLNEELLEYDHIAHTSETNETTWNNYSNEWQTINLGRFLLASTSFGLSAAATVVAAKEQNLVFPAAL